MLLKSFAPAVAAGVTWMAVAAFSPARADLSYTLTAHIHSKHAPFGITPVVRAAFYFQGRRERVDSSLIIPIMGRHTSVIADCDTGDTYSFNSSTGVWAVVDDTASSPDPFGISAMMSGFADVGKKAKPPAQQAPTQSGTVTIYAKVVDKGVLVADGISSHDWMVSLTTSATGGASADIGPPDVEVWTDTTPLPIACATERALDALPADPASPDQPGVVHYRFTGDVAALRTVLGYAPVRLQFRAEEQGITINFERSKLSTDPLDGKLFEAPSADTSTKRPPLIQNKDGSADAAPASSAGSSGQ